MDNSFSAVIIKGAIDESLHDSAESFYSELTSYIEKQGFSVTVHNLSEESDVGEADVWVVDKYGQEKLESTPNYVRVLNLHDADSDNDFALTADKKIAIKKTLQAIIRLAEFQERIIKLADKICMS